MLICVTENGFPHNPKNVIINIKDTKVEWVHMVRLFDS